MEEKIQLNHVVPPQKYQLLKCGIVYYTWVKSNRKNRHYLLPLKQCEKTVRRTGAAVFLFVLTILFGVWLYREQWRWELMLFCGMVGGILYFLVCQYVRRAVQIIGLLPRFPIAVADLDRGFLIIRNRSALPFVQICEDTWRVELPQLQYVRENTAYKICNGKEKLWRYLGKSPTWTALTVGYGESPGQCRTQLLFVGIRIPENIVEFFDSTLGLDRELHADNSLFDT